MKNRCCATSTLGAADVSVLHRPLALTNPFSSVVQFNNARFRKRPRSEKAIEVLGNALGMCKSEADRSDSAIGVLKNALRICKREADKSESAIGVLKKCRDSRGHPRTSADAWRHSTKISPH